MSKATNANTSNTADLVLAQSGGYKIWLHIDGECAIARLTGVRSGDDEVLGANEDIFVEVAKFVPRPHALELAKQFTLREIIQSGGKVKTQETMDRKYSQHGHNFFDYLHSLLVEGYELNGVYIHRASKQ